MSAPVTYQLRIVLTGTKPPVWRRILVSPFMKLDHLHEVIQVVMGWEDCHLHMFRKDGERYSIPSPWDGDWRVPGTPADRDERKYRISHLLAREGDWITYEYDFGDSWEHKVTLQKMVPEDRGVRLPKCISGKRRCPPEDCGGVWGYQEMLDVLRSPAHPEHEHMRRWVGGDFDPDDFSPSAVNRVLLQTDW